MNHAGLQEADISGYSCELENKNDIGVYEIEFYANRVEYEYEVDALSGSILKSEKERND